MNYKRFTLVSTLILVILAANACGFGWIRGSGNLITESRDISNIDRVDLSGSGKLIITQSGEESLTVETDDDMMQYVSTEVRDGTLYLGFEDRDSKNQTLSPTRLRFTLTVDNLTGLDVSGSGDISTASLDTDRLEVNIGGSGEVQVDSLMAGEVEIRIGGSGEVQVNSLMAGEVEVLIGGNGHVELAGEATRQDISINGSGQYDAENLRSETVKINIGGSGNATVWATESLDASVGGSGSVRYYGSPQTSFSGSGSGKIKGLGEK